MRKLIKELEPQCWEHNEFGLNFNYEKFAKLIVQECASIINNDGRFLTYTALEKKIKKHFGVE